MFDGCTEDVKSDLWIPNLNVRFTADSLGPAKISMTEAIENADMLTTLLTDAARASFCKRSK